MKVDKTKWTQTLLGHLIKEHSIKNKSLKLSNVYSVTNSKGFIPAYEYFDNTVQSSNLSTYKIVEKGMFAYNPSRINVGSIALLEQEEQVIVSPLYVIFSLKAEIEPYYLLSFLKSDVGLSLIRSRTSGSVRASLRFKDLSSITIPLPPISEQKCIATELDAVQAMIDGYRQQLADLDALARSIFLETFGDPISNPKGWETSEFGILFSLKSGDGLSANNFNGGDFPVYGGNGITGFHNKYNKDGLYIIIGRVGALCGNIHLVSGKFWLTDNAFELIPKKSFYNIIYLSMLLSLLKLGNKAKKMAQPVISNIALKNISVVVPPLSLQQQFASQVEAIEKQKDLLRQQIADAEMLMAERMQYYFS